MNDDHQVSRLVALLEKKLGNKVPAKPPQLRVVPPISLPPPRLFDAVTRDAHLQRIRYLARGYDLSWLIEQATFDQPAGLNGLSDPAILQLHRDMDRAMDCRRLDIAYDEAGLVRELSTRTIEDFVDDWGDGEDCRKAG